MTGSMKDWFSVDDLAEWLQVSRQTVYKWGSDETGPVAHRISERCIRFRREDVEAWLEQRRDKPTGDEKVES